MDNNFKTEYKVRCKYFKNEENCVDNGKVIFQCSLIFNDRTHETFPLCTDTHIISWSTYLIYKKHLIVVE